MRMDSIKKRIKRALFYSYFNKVFFLFFFLTVAVGICLMMILSDNLREIKFDQSIDMSDQILASVDDFLEEKINAEKELYRRFLEMESQWEVLLEQLEKGEGEEISHQEFAEMQKSFGAIAAAVDSQFSGLYAADLEEGNVYSISDTTDSGNYYYFEKQAEQIRETGEAFSNTLVTSRGNHLNHDYSVFLLDAIHEPEDFTKDIGILGVCFHIRSLRQAYQKLEPYLKGQIYILNASGEIIFDSDGKYVKEYIPTERLKEESGIFEEDDCLYNMIFNEHRNFYLLNRIPVAAIDQDVRSLQKSILGVMSLALLLMLAVCFVGTRYFSKRLGSIGNVIEQVKNGRLTGFKTEKQADDEVGYIYRELLTMCSDLNHYIEREYVYQLHQKEMELYTMQAQINPHFLYNTLEAIRMNLYVKGNREASQMIYKLSEMFRNIMKKGPVVTLREEFNYVQSYLELHQFRLGKRMKFEFVVAAEVYHYATVKYILQPIIENTVIHGIQDWATEEEPGMVRIWAWKEEGDILIGVEDNGVGIPAEKLNEIQKRLKEEEMFQESIGIYNVNNRLRIVYGSEYGLKIASAQGKGTAVTIRLKAMTKKELEDYVQRTDS